MACGGCRRSKEPKEITSSDEAIASASPTPVNPRANIIAKMEKPTITAEWLRTKIEEYTKLLAEMENKQKE